MENATNTNWTTSPSASGTNSTAGYDPPALTATTYYQRVVTSGRCVSYSSTVTVNVLPLITGNVTSRPDSVICEGSLFNALGASLPGGGDTGNYIYQWQDSTASSVWSPAVGINNAPGYTPDTTVFSVIEDRYMRRIVLSGADNVCKSNSLPIHLTRYHKIKTNTILADQTICSGSTPTPLSGSVPTQGKTGDYTYIWQDSTRAHIWTPVGTTDFNYVPGSTG